MALLLVLLCACAPQQKAEDVPPEAAPETTQTDNTGSEAGTDGAEESKGGYEYLPETAESEPEEPEEEPETPTPEAAEAERAARRDAAVRTCLARMSTEDKVAQMFFARCPSVGVTEKLAQYRLGGLLLFGQDFRDASGGWLSRDAVVERLASYQEAAAHDGGVPLFIGTDEEGGTVARVSGNPNLFPEKAKSPQKLYAEGGLAAILNDASQKSYLLGSIGVNVNFAPVCDVSVDPDDFIYDRALGQDAASTAVYVEKVVGAMGSAGVAAVLKHFPGYGSNADTHGAAVIDERPYERFDSVDFLPFEAGIAAGAPFVMVSHVVVSCMDAARPASLSPTIHRILRGGLGFEGVIITDDLSMDAIDPYLGESSAAVLAIKAGNDMIVTENFEKEIPEVLAAVEFGSITDEMLNESCTRILRVKYDLGLLGE